MERKKDGGVQTPEILREELPMQRFEGQKTSQAVVEGEVALPGGLREETRVLCSEAMAVLEQTDVQPGRVDAEGNVTAIAPGKCEIRAESANGRADFCEIIVS